MLRVAFAHYTFFNLWCIWSIYFFPNRTWNPLIWIITVSLQGTLYSYFLICCFCEIFNYWLNNFYCIFHFCFWNYNNICFIRDYFLWKSWCKCLLYLNWIVYIIWGLLAILYRFILCVILLNMIIKVW